MKSLLLIALAVACANGAPSDMERIVGGEVVTDPEAYPYLVSISENSEHICGGFIYNDRWVVTAASCLDGKDLLTLEVKVGSTSLITPGPEEQKLPVLETQIYPDFDATTGLHNIALLQTGRPIVFNNYAQAIRYDEVFETGGVLVESNEIAGWGATFDSGIVATRLRSAPVAHVDDASVNCDSFGSAEYQRNYMVCAGDEIASPCSFDEGTPLVQVYKDGINRIAVGIMSKFAPNCAAPSPSIYTRLSAYYAWLLKTAGQQPAPTA